MARLPSTTDFKINVDGVGGFTFARRKMGDQLAIHRELAKIYDGIEPTEWLERVGGWISTLKVLTVAAPDGWDIEQMDPLEDETYVKLEKVFWALRAKEDSFRPRPDDSRAGTGAGST